jgi:3-dehydroquinate synthetase
MVMAARFAEGLNMLPQGQAERLRQLLVGLKLPVALQDAVDPQAMLRAMGMDKKAQDGNLRFVVSEGFGAATLIDSFDPQVLQAILAEFC